LNADGSVDLKLKTHISQLGGQERAASRAAEALEPLVPHYVNITQQYNAPRAGSVSYIFYQFQHNFHLILRGMVILQ
jgi:hypothetical protein